MVHLKNPSASNEGPRLIMYPVGVSSCTHRVNINLYGKNMADIAIFLRLCWHICLPSIKALNA